MKLILGDCITEMQKMDSSCVDMVFTSPPYNRKRNDKYQSFDDSIDDYLGFLVASIDEMLRVSRGPVFFNIQKNFYNKIDVFKLFGHYAEQIYDVFIWGKSQPIPANGGKSITNAYEFIICFGNNVRSNRIYTKNHFVTGNAKMTKQHRAMMHPEVADLFIQDFSSEGQTVLDPFMGMGTTAISCLKFNRKFIGIEIAQEYFDHAKANIQMVTTAKRSEFVD